MFPSVSTPSTSSKSNFIFLARSNSCRENLGIGVFENLAIGFCNGNAMRLGASTQASCRLAGNPKGQSRATAWAPTASSKHLRGPQIVDMDHAFQFPGAIHHH